MVAAKDRIIIVGTRYRNPDYEKNEHPKGASEKSIIFSGFTGPIFFIDFEKKIVILVMTNVCHISTMDRVEKYRVSKELVAETYKQIDLQAS